MRSLGATSTASTRFLPVAAGLLLVACQPQPTPGLDLPVHDLPTCALELPVRALDFGDLRPGATVTRSLPVRNPSSATSPCVVPALTLEAAEAGGLSVVEPSPTGQLLAPGAEARWTLLAAPTAWPLNPGPFVARAVVAAASASSTGDVVSLTGAFAQGCLALETTSLDLGEVPVLCSRAARTVAFTSTCARTVEVASTQVSGEAQGFHLVAAPPLAPGRATAWALKFSPGSEGEASGSLTATLRDGAQERTVTVGLTGRGTTGARQTDTFVAPRNATQLDVLVVVDASPSMAAHQSSLATNLEWLGRVLEASGTDLHLAVAPATGQADGRLHPGASGTSLFTTATPDLARDFVSAANVGVQSSEPTGCIDTALAVLTGPTAAPGFLRPEARLNIVCVTDGLERSPLSSPEALARLLDVKGPRLAHLLHYSVAGPLGAAVAGCGVSGAVDDGRHRYLVEATHGGAGDLCAPDWSRDLDVLPPTACWGSPNRFPLSARPANAALTDWSVTVNGAPLAASVPWTWEEPTNALVFLNASLLQPGDVLRVGYPVACGP